MLFSFLNYFVVVYHIEIDAVYDGFFPLNMKITLVKYQIITPTYFFTPT